MSERYTVHERHDSGAPGKAPELPVVEYTEPTAFCYGVIQVLPFLRGRKLDQLSWNAMHAVRPSSIRVIKPYQGIKLDSHNWRLTVYVDDEGRIKRCDQEVEFGGHVTEDVYCNGHELQCWLEPAGTTVEEKLRNILDAMEVPGAQSFTAGDLVELANLVSARRDERAL